MFCYNCGTELPEGAKFCFKCGKTVADNAGIVHKKDRAIKRERKKNMKIVVAALVADLCRESAAKGCTVFVDPVMGDNGALYAGFTPAFVEKMRGLCKQANYILPNETEAAFLSALPYPLPHPEEAIEKLKTLCSRPIITGVEQDKIISVHYADGRGVCRRFPTERVAGFFPGSGDIFASVFVGALAKGKSQEQAVALATDFTTAAIRRSKTEVEDKRYGLNFEKEIYTLLKKLNGDNA